MFYCYYSLNNKELLRDIVDVNLCEFSKHIKNDIATLGPILEVLSILERTTHCYTTSLYEI